MSSEKQKVALNSVIAALFLTIVKIIVGVFTGSLGIISEAVHSAMDLGAAVITLFAVKISDKPADSEHNYGHGKIESFSALLETLLLLFTCGWIIYEAVERIFFGKSIEVDGTIWGILVMILAITIDVSRSLALKRVAKKYNSQALEADALHFSSDVWSSCVVIGGLICVGLGNYFNLPVLRYGDPIAALGVSVLVIVVSIRLGKRTIDVLLDTAPKGMAGDILKEINGIKGVLDVGSVRIRPSGPEYYIDINVGINRNESHRVVHAIVHEIRERVQTKIPNSDIVISTFPVDTAGIEDMEVYHSVKKVVDNFPVCTNIHNIHVYELADGKHISTHLEIKENLSLNELHELSHHISQLIQQELKDVKDVSVNFELVKQSLIRAEDVTEQNEEIICIIESLINKVPDRLNCHDIRIYKQGDKFSIFLHCGLYGDFTTEKIEKISKKISNKLKTSVKGLENVHIHVEPID